MLRAFPVWKLLPLFKPLPWSLSVFQLGILGPQQALKSLGFPIP